MAGILKYFSGAGGAEKHLKRKLEGDAQQKRKEYETSKRSRTFMKHWKVGRTWLEYDTNLNIMKCTPCAKFYENKPLKDQWKLWVNGTSNFKIDTVKSHESSLMHVDATKAVDTNVTKSDAGRAVRMLNAKEYSKVELRFRNAHAIAKHDKSFRDYVWLCKLDTAKGLDTGSTYENDKSAKEFVKQIAEVEIQKTTNTLKEVKYFSLTIDGAMDIAGDEQESIYLYWSQKGQRVQRFLQFVSPRSTSSQDIYDAVVETLNEFDIDVNKLVGVTTDGASNMMGRRNGFCSLLKRNINQNIISTHCLAHRMELSVKDSVKDINNKLYDKTMTLLIGLFYFYKRSSLQKKRLKESFIANKLSCLIPTRVGGTRWVPHTLRGINVFLKSYPAIMSQLDTASHKVPKAEGLAKLGHNYSVVVYILVLKELLEPLSKLSLYLQRTETTLADAYSMIQSTKTVLETYEKNQSEELKEVLASSTFKGFKLKGPVPALSYRTRFMNALIENLDARFSSDQVILKSTSLASLKLWPLASQKDKIKGIHIQFEFGEKDVAVLFDHFNKFEDKTSLMVEWNMLKAILYQRYGDKVGTLDWRTINQATEGQGVDQILQMIDLVLSLPATSVMNERSFSHMKLIKSEKRGRLSTRILSTIMVVKCETAGVSSFDPKEAIDQWMVTPSGRPRRPNFSRINKVVENNNNEAEDGQNVIDLDEESHTEQQLEQNLNDNDAFQENTEEDGEDDDVDDDDDDDEDDEQDEQSYNENFKKIMKYAKEE